MEENGGDEIVLEGNRGEEILLDENGVPVEETKSEKFFRLIEEDKKKKGKNSVQMSKSSYNFIVSRLRAINNGEKAGRNDLNYIKNYHLVDIDGTFVLHKTTTSARRKDRIGRIVPAEEIYDIIFSSHDLSTHGGRDVMLKDLKKTFHSITRSHIEIFLKLCETCELKKRKEQKGIVVRPILSNDLNSRCQVDLIDYQSKPDGPYKHVLVYQDHLTKFVRLLPLKTKTMKEVAEAVLSIMLVHGAPNVLQSDNGREFSNQLIQAIVALWPSCKMVHGKPRHSQSQGSVERANRDVKDMLACWMRDHNSRNWSVGLQFVMFSKNNRYHKGIDCTPFEAMYGTRAQQGLLSITQLPSEFFANVHTEEELGNLLGIEIEDDETDGAAPVVQQIPPPAPAVQQIPVPFPRKRLILPQPAAVHQVPPAAPPVQQVPPLPSSTQEVPRPSPAPASDIPRVPTNEHTAALALLMLHTNETNQEIDRPAPAVQPINPRAPAVQPIPPPAPAFRRIPPPVPVAQRIPPPAPTNRGFRSELQQVQLNTVDCKACERLVGPLTGIECHTCQAWIHDADRCGVQKKEPDSEKTTRECLLCINLAATWEIREGARNAQKKQAKQMLQHTQNNMTPVNVGDTVVVPIAKVDRGPCDLQNIMAVVLEFNSCTNNYTLGTKHGKLDHLYTRGQFTPCSQSFLDPAAVPNNNISFREAVRHSSIGGGQGYKHCACRFGCSSNKCTCKKANRLCSSRCHKSLSCQNKG